MTTTAAAPTLPPSSTTLRRLTSLGFIADRRRTIGWQVKQNGRWCTLQVPVFGKTVVVADPALAKQIFTTGPDVLYNEQPNLSRVFGGGSVFALDGADHRKRRKLLTPPFHGKCIAAYERIAEEETLREMATWPDGMEFGSLEPMMCITLNVILRGVFGADGVELEELRDVVPKWVTLASKLALLPIPRTGGRWNPWTKLDSYRGTYDSLIAKAHQDPKVDERGDILALFLRSTYDDGTTMTRAEIGDELLTRLCSANPTTQPVRAVA